jgi:chemotaxis signal transduction protein
MSCVTGLGKYRGRLIMLLDMNKLLEFSGLRPAKASAEESAQRAEARGAGGR